MLTSLINVQYCYTYTVEQISLGLLMYSYIPTAIIAVLFGLFLLYKNRTIQGLTLSVVCFLFAVWSLLNLSTWFSFLGSANTMFTWSILDLIGLMFFFFAYYFLYTFSTNRDLPLLHKIIGICLLIPTAVWTFLGSGLSGYDANYCEALENTNITNYLFSAEGVYILVVFIFVIVNYFRTKDVVQKKESTLAGVGIFIFLSFFLVATYGAALLTDYDIWQHAYNIEIYGMFGMPLLLAFLVYTMVKFKAFDIKLIGSQALVWALVLLIGAEFFFVTNLTNQILVGITLILSTIVGLIIVRSVKKEIAQKELLEIANNDKSEFISFASHQIRTPLTSIKGYSANILDGDYGPLTDEMKDAIQKILVRGTDAVTLISQYLDKSKMELGQLKYDFSDFDLAELAQSVTKGFEPNAEQAKLTIKFSTDGSGPYMVNADKGKIKETVGNLIDNAIKYTPTGSIEVYVYKKADKVLVRFSDTGVGMSKEVIADLYKKFGRAEDAGKTNILGTGLGLFLAKTFMEAMKGRSWAESEGKGKGSQFYIELPIKVEQTATPTSVNPAN